MPQLSNELVRREASAGIVTLTLDNPDRGNALSEAMIDALEARIAEVAGDAEARVVILAANGRIFCAGHDLREMRQHEDTAWFEDLFARCSRLMQAIRSCPQPVIARVRGAAVAAGCQLVATCDLAYAADTARFGVSGINLGLFCSTPSVALSRVVPPRQALELLLTGRLVGAARAAEMGLINAAVADDALDATVADIAGSIAAKLPEATILGKDLFYRQLPMDVDAAYALSGRRMAENMGFPGTCAGIDAFLQRG